jgi:uroporphyrinogen-III synthase
MHNCPRILITRPKAQSQNLSRLIAQQGGQAVLFPVIEIQAVAEAEAELNQLNRQLTDYYGLIFTSANAVQYSVAQLVLPASLQRAVIGQSTANALQQHGYVTTICPPQFNSEALLAMPALSTERVRQQRIALIKGQGGRELLAETLRQRGAALTEIAVYRRCLPQSPVLPKPPFAAVIVTSVESLHHLFALFSPADGLAHTPLVVISQRVANSIVGVSSPIWVADQANDQGLLNALLAGLG